VVPSVKILALSVQFGVGSKARMVSCFLECFPNIETLHVRVIEEIVNFPYLIGFFGHSPLLQDSGKVRVRVWVRDRVLERRMRRHGHTVASQRHSVSWSSGLRSVAERRGWAGQGEHRDQEWALGGTTRLTKRIESMNGVLEVEKLCIIICPSRANTVHIKP